MAKFETSICRKGEDFNVVVEFDYSPAEAPEWHHEAPGYPGCDASLELTKVKLDGIDILDTLTADEKEALTQEAWDSLPEPDECDGCRDRHRCGGDC